jgi:hypothetical protein
MTLMFAQSRFARRNIKQDRGMGRSNLVPHESKWGVSVCFIRSIKLTNSRTQPLQMEHDGQMSSDRSHGDAHLENCETEARRILPNSLIANQRGRVTLLRLPRPPNEMPSTIRQSPASTPSSAIRWSRRAPLSCTARESIFRPAPSLFALTGVEPHPYNRHRISVR